VVGKARIGATLKNGGGVEEVSHCSFLGAVSSSSIPPHLNTFGLARQTPRSTSQSYPMMVSAILTAVKLRACSNVNIGSPTPSCPIEHPRHLKSSRHTTHITPVQTSHAACSRNVTFLPFHRECQVLHGA
jgi:hypothetical protein